MDNLYQLGLRSQTIVGGFHFLFFLFSWPFVIGFLKDYHDNDRLTFNCIPKPNDFTKQRCYDNYTSAVSPGLTPLDFAGMNYGTLGFLWLFFILMGAMTLRRIHRERSEQGKTNQWKTFMRRFVYHVCAQLVVLSVMMGLFCAYQTIHLPSEYKCYRKNMTLTSFNPRPVNMTCNDLRYKEKSKLNIAIIVIMTISIVFCLLTLIHLGVTRRTGQPLPEHLLGNIFEREDGNAERVTLRAVNSYSLALKASVMEQTEFQPKLFDKAPAISCMRTDDIFTNVLIQYGRKTLEYDENTGRRDRLTRYGQVSSRRITQCSELFIRFTNDEGNPKSILVTGKAGIGKTLFCQKLLRDWADNRLFQTQTNLQLPDFKFAYLLTFSNLNLLGDEELTVKEILERCSFLDDQCLRSNMDTFPLEYILDHSEEVLIIIDGFDEYFNQGQDYIAGDYHEEYPNCSERKMKIAAFCAKVINKKILKQATIMITSRPDESDKLSKIEFDRIAEVTGFSEQQVTEYIERYFRRNESFKRTVLEHITRNENLVSFAHIPVLCALMCSYFEYTLKKSERLKDLPVSVSDLHNEVLNIFERNHIEKKIPNFRESTLDILSKFAADLLLKRKYLFKEEEMLSFTSKEVVENLRMSGLVHCGPPFNASFSETTKYFCFSHLTLHEYLAARWFVKGKMIHLYGKVSTMVIQFMAGILSKSNDSVLMDQLMKDIPLQFNREYLLEAKCLNEYQNKEYAKNYYHQLGAARHENIVLSDMNDVDSFALLFLMDVFISLNEEKTTHPNQALSEQPSICVKSLTISKSSLTLSGVKRVCHFLRSNVCAVAELELQTCGLSDECVRYICRLVSTSLLHQRLFCNLGSDAGVASLSEALKQSTCQLTALYLYGNQITDAGVAILSEALKQSTCQLTTLDLSDNHITDAGVASLSEALKQSTCQLTTLNLSYMQITDAGVASLSEALKQSTCQLTKLILIGIQITNAGVASLSEALKQPTCQLNELCLFYNEITDDGAASLSEALKQSTCQLTKLHLNCNQITDTGVASLSEALKQSTCKLTELRLAQNQITDAGAASLGEAIKQSTCQLTTLTLPYNNISDSVAVSLCGMLKQSTV